RLPVVVEVEEDLDLGAPGSDPAPPALQLALGVVAPAAATPVVEANVGPIRGDLVGLERALRVIADHQRGAMATQQDVDLLGEPARVPELEAVATLRQTLQRRPEAIIVALEALRQLPQHRAELSRRHQRPERIEESLRAFADRLQTLDVGQVATRLEGEH